MTQIDQTFALARAERHVTEGEAWMARQACLIESLIRGDHSCAVAHARKVQGSLQALLDSARERLRRERATLGIVS